jgi:predicted RNA polymerase sigma factor
MVDGPDAGLAMLASIESDSTLADGNRLPAVRAQLDEMAGNLELARTDHLEAARRTTSVPEQRYLLDRASRLP